MGGVVTFNFRPPYRVGTETIGRYRAKALASLVLLRSPGKTLGLTVFLQLRQTLTPY